MLPTSFLLTLLLGSGSTTTAFTATTPPSFCDSRSKTTTSLFSTASAAAATSSSSSNARFTSGSKTAVPPTPTSLSPHTFAGMVEQAMIDRFGDGDNNDNKNIERILQSWRLMSQEYVHDEFFGKDPKTSNMRQYCYSYVPGLTIQPFWNVNDFQWCTKLKSKYKAIRKEFDSVTADMETLKQQGNNIWAGALTEDAGSYGEGWKTLVLMDRGMWDATNVNLFPVTAKAVRDSGVHCTEVFFASMKPNSAIKMHSDFTNFVLTSHLPLDIPYSGQNKCRLTIGDETREWINGNIMMFDTSLMHDAINESDKTRYILMLRLWHPDLTDVERQALQFTYNCLEYPGLVSTNPQERHEAEQQVQQMRAFPEIVRGAGKKTGFGGGGSSANKKKSKRK